MAQHQLRKMVKAKKLDKDGQPIGTSEFPVPAGAVISDLFEEHGNMHFIWNGQSYGLPAGMLGGAYKEVD